jgi:hypothetical protein
MQADEAKRLVLDLVRVEASDVTDAKVYLSTLTGEIDLIDIARERATAIAGHPETEMPLWQNDPAPAIRVFARHLAAQCAVFMAAWDLVHCGTFAQTGRVEIFQPHMAWTTVAPGSGGHRAGERLNELHYPYPARLLRPAWFSTNSILADADLYLRTLNAVALNPGIGEALRQSVRAFSVGLYVPTMAMLDAASEGAWIEAGQALSTKPPVDATGSKLSATLTDARTSMRAKASAVCDYYDRRKDVQQRAGVPSNQLRETLLWSGLVRDARNVLHWGVSANIPNSYSVVSTFLLGALNHVRRLHLITMA